MNKLTDFLGRIFSGEGALSFINRSSDLMLAGWILAVIVMIILPVPPPIIDLAITFNLTAAIGLIMVALYIPSAIHLSMFPSLLLVTTLFRLGVSISAARQILLNAYAGHIILAFGNFVVGGNYVVGLVIFIIITIVQFIVVIKGAERVAEVAARFRLDAMPGKQMAIDADLRAGSIDANQAREKRALIQKESELYGAMDGAMKFVKGDVIAGMVIAFVNVVGGLIIGVAMHHMTMGQAAKVYTLLSIGDGLVSQIPSLLIALTAGIVTTRVSSERRDANLGKEISAQLLREPRALLIAAGAIFGIGFFKGFPLWTFTIIALLIAITGIAMIRRRKKEAAKVAAGGGTVETDVEGHALVKGGVEDFTLTLPVLLEVGKNLSDLIKKGKGKGTLSLVEDLIPKMRQALYQDLGIRYPGVHVRTDSPLLEADEYSIMLNEVPVTRGKIPDGYLLTNELEENLRRYNLPYISYKNAAGLPSLWVENRYREVMDKAGIKFWQPLEVVILHLSYFFRQNGQEFIGIQEVRSMLEFMETFFP
jgi:type III secretion protein V